MNRKMTTENNATANAEPKEWKTRSMIDADLRLPKSLREKLKIKGHESYTIKITKQNKDGFTLSFQKSE